MARHTAGARAEGGPMTAGPTRGVAVSELHRMARLYADDGLAVLPLIPGGKTPACQHGHKDASTDIATIDRWWSENPNYNIGAVPASIGCLVVDLDVKGGKDGIAEFDRLSIQHTGHPAPPTRTVRTPSGGLHLWFSGTVEKDGAAGALGPGIDIKCHGYVVMPPSFIVGTPTS